MPDRERTTRTAAIVLRHREMGEADRLLTLYTEQLGKVRAIAKGVRRLRSRKAGHLEPFTYANLQLARGRDLMIITQAETVDAFLPLRDDLDKVGQASYVIELIDRFTYDSEENSTIFRLIVQTLGRLQTSSDPALVLRYYEMRLLDYLGFRPELQKCTSCEKAIQPEDQYFSALHGGVLCPTCGKGVAGAPDLRQCPALSTALPAQRLRPGPDCRARPGGPHRAGNPDAPLSDLFVGTQLEYPGFYAQTAGRTGREDITPSSEPT